MKQLPHTPDLEAVARNTVWFKSPEEAIKIADKTYLEWLERHQEYSQLPHPVFNPPSNNQL